MKQFTKEFDDTVGLLGCDTMVALPGDTVDGNTLFAKNSDRRFDECQTLMQVAKAKHKLGVMINCDFIQVPQVEITNRHVGSRPFWCWGYEHGFNEYQVVIGNEALQSRLEKGQEARLNGMDLVRLGLERGRSAEESVDVITGLVSRYGQGQFVGNSKFSDYDNGFIVSDPKEAYIIETAGHEWAVKVVDRALGISNVHSIEMDWVRLSPTAEKTAITDGVWQASSGRLNFREAYIDLEKASSGSGTNRRARLCAFLNARAGGIDLSTMMSLVSDHSDGINPNEPHRSMIPSEVSVCMHHSEATKANTAATLISHLCADSSRLPVYWCSFYSPCLGVFLPIFSEGRLPKVLSVGDQHFSAKSPWWLFYDLERRARQSSDSNSNSVDEIRAAWMPVQNNLVKSAYDVATEAGKLNLAGESALASELLTEYMDSNATMVLEKVRGILSQIDAMAVVASD